MRDIQDNHDGFHSFKELYMHRAALFACLVNLYKDYFVKSKAHNDGTSFNGYFLVIGTLPGLQHQVSYHIQLDYWSLFKCESVDKAPIWNGHSAKDVYCSLLLFSQIEKIDPNLRNPAPSGGMIKVSREEKIVGMNPETYPPKEWSDKIRDVYNDEFSKMDSQQSGSK